MQNIRDPATCECFCNSGIWSWKVYIELKCWQIRSLLMLKLGGYSEKEWFEWCCYHLKWSLKLRSWEWQKKKKKKIQKNVAALWGQETYLWWYPLFMWTIETLFLASCLIFMQWEMICLQQFYNIFTTNLKWQVVIGCYCWVKKVISVLKRTSDFVSSAIV